MILKYRLCDGVFFFFFFSFGTKLYADNKQNMKILSQSSNTFQCIQDEDFRESTRARKIAFQIERIRENLDIVSRVHPPPNRTLHTQMAWRDVFLFLFIYFQNKNSGKIYPASSTLLHFYQETDALLYIRYKLHHRLLPRPFAWMLWDYRYFRYLH